MGTYRLELSEKARQDLKYIKKTGKKSDISKAENLLRELESHPRKGTGKPERLKYQDNGEIWSRRINQKDRLIYEIFEDRILILIYNFLGHYKDK